MSAESGFEWTDQFLLGYQPMDETHKEFVELVAALLTAQDADLLAALDAFIQHAEGHFAQELEWMSSSDFPALDCHVEDHEKVMQSVSQVRELVTKGNTQIARDFAHELANWFPSHAGYLDSALAQWMVRKQFGGAPVVLRRRNS